jgi:hypothetical protein
LRACILPKIESTRDMQWCIADSEALILKLGGGEWSFRVSQEREITHALYCRKWLLS